LCGYSSQIAFLIFSFNSEKASRCVNNDPYTTNEGVVVPDAFTHGTSQQRVYWFKKGYETGDISQGITFGDTSLN
jgi:predicted metalloprotease